MKQDLNSILLEKIRTYHRGKVNAIKLRILAHEFGLKDDRKIRIAIKELNEQGYPIVTSTEPPMGVYWAVSQSELDEYRANLISRLTSLKERIEDVEKMRIEPQQMRMFGG